MKRIMLMVAYNILLVPYMWFKLCYYASHVDKYTEEQRYKVLRFIDNRAIKGEGLKLTYTDRKTYRSKTDLCFSRTIRVSLMFYPL